MKHTNPTPAIYATKRRAYLVQPGQTVPKNARFIICHADLTALAWAYDKSTFGNRDGTREPGPPVGVTYEAYAEQVLHRVMRSQKNEPELTIEEFQKLRHTLGSSHTGPTQGLGWRNYYATDSVPPDEVASLVARSIMEKAGDGMYRATARGMELAGAAGGHE